MTPASGRGRAAPSERAKATRPIVLVTIGSYLPGFRAGGPIRSIAHLVDHLSDEFDFRILTSDRDLGDTGPYAGVELDRWTPVGPALVHYASPGRLTPREMARTIRDVSHDLLYLNSFFSPRFTILPLVLRRLGLIPGGPIVLAPRGEFSSGALALKAAKKRAYLAAGRALGLFGGVRWQASSAFEEQDIRRLFGARAEVAIASDLPASLDSGPPAHVPRAPGGTLRVLFLGRLSPVKNLDFALFVLARVHGRVAFDIYGPAEDEAYHRSCLAIAQALPANIRVGWKGAVRHDEVGALMARYDLFFLPTRGENFGHVIAESLAAGTPVLVSDTTPWRGLAEAGVGCDLPLDDPMAFAARIEALAAEPVEAALARRGRAAAYVRERQRSGDDILANRDLFRRALGL